MFRSSYGFVYCTFNDVAPHFFFAKAGDINSLTLLVRSLFSLNKYEF